MLELCRGEKRCKKLNVFDKPSAEPSLLELCRGEKRCKNLNVFDKPSAEPSLLELCRGEKRCKNSNDKKQLSSDPEWQRPRLLPVRPSRFSNPLSASERRIVSFSSQVRPRLRCSLGTSNPAIAYQILPRATATVWAREPCWLSARTATCGPRRPLRPAISTRATWTSTRRG